MLHPSVFSERHYNCTVIRLPEYIHELDALSEPVHPALRCYPNPYDITKSAGKPWEYLLEPRKMELVGSISRGKQLAIWAGHVSALHCRKSALRL